MGRGISEVLTFAVGVAISPAAIVAVILMLFSRRARVNGPLFLLGWEADFPDASNFLTVLLHSRSRDTNNNTFYANGDVDRYLYADAGSRDLRNGDLRQC